MINVNELKIFIDFIANKEQSGTAYSINQLNNAFQAANIDFFNLRYGLPEEYAPGTPVPIQGYEVTQKMKDDLKACKVVATLPVTSSGEMILPSDYVHYTAMTYTKVLNANCGESPISRRKQIEVIDDDKWDERLDNSIKFPSLDFPVANFLSDRIRCEPKTLKEVEFSYLRIPNKPIWGYTIQNGVEIYDANLSTDFDWSGTLLTNIGRIILGYLSINLRDDELHSAIEEYKDKGV